MARDGRAGRAVAEFDTTGIIEIGPDPWVPMRIRSCCTLH
jgi:hypothetical protein